MLNGKTAIVTGGGSGIGAATAQAFANAGAKVCVADLNFAAARQVADQIGGLAVECDVCDETQIIDLVQKTEAKFGPVDVFLSNAGLARGEPSHAASASTETWQLNWNVHVMAHVFATRAVLPGMIERGQGYLINVASAAGLLNQIGDAAYSATKHAAVSLAESLAITHAGDGIDVSVVCPQYVATPLLDMDSNTETNDSLLSTERVAECIVAGMKAKDFLILPHPKVADYVSLKGSDRARWLAGMQGLRSKFLRETDGGDLKEMYKYT
jgi:NAD(P)-dependent dehydrogenase (short-subunit alcohol dehydrogenase family)